jgi:hypothetical protein
MSQVSDSEPLRPPTGAADPTGDLDEPAPHEPSRAGDDFAWLYRQDGSAPGVTGGDPLTLVLPLDSQPSYVSSHQPVPLMPPPSVPRGRNPMVIMIVILLCLTTGAITGIALLLQSDFGTATPGSAQSSVEKDASPDALQSVQVAALTPTQVQVVCQAPQTTDGAGNPVTYVPEQMFDGRMNTAWRCNGDGVGQVVTFDFPAGATIVEVGLVNGYAKVDPATGAERYGEYRRISKVTWTFANGTSFQQSLNDGVTTMQKLKFSPQQGDRVTLTIEASTGPGSTARGRDAVVISEVAFGHSS